MGWDFRTVWSWNRFFGCKGCFFFYFGSHSWDWHIEVRRRRRLQSELFSTRLLRWLNCLDELGESEVNVAPEAEVRGGAWSLSTIATTSPQNFHDVVPCFSQRAESRVERPLMSVLKKTALEMSLKQPNAKTHPQNQMLYLFFVGWCFALSSTVSLKFAALQYVMMTVFARLFALFPNLWTVIGASVFAVSALNQRWIGSKKKWAGLVYLCPSARNISCNVDFMCGDDGSAPLKQCCGCKS